MPAGAIAGERIRALAGEGVPGVVILVAGPDGVRAAGGARLADIAARVPASPGMVCAWFSMTKIVTATAAVRLAERGLASTRPAWSRRCCLTMTPPPEGNPGRRGPDVRPGGGPVRGRVLPLCAGDLRQRGGGPGRGPRRPPLLPVPPRALSGRRPQRAGVCLRVRAWAQHRARDFGPTAC